MQLVAWIISMFLLSGCISIPQRDETTKADSKLLCANIGEIEGTFPSPFVNTEYVTEKPHEWNKEIIYVLRRGDLQAAGFDLSCAGGKESTYDIKVKEVRLAPLGITGNIWRFSSILTLGIIPYREETLQKVSVYDSQSNALVGEGENHLVNWGSAILFPYALIRSYEKRESNRESYFRTAASIIRKSKNESSQSP